MIAIPPYLKKDDLIGIVCPSGFMPLEKAETCINTIKKWGYKIKVGKTLGNQFHYFSGTDKERLNDLQQMLDDENIKAILCARGGYGLSRIIDEIDFTQFVKNPKWIIGFSDVTVLQLHIFSKYKIASMHSPMAAAFNDDGFKNEYVQSLKNTLSGKTSDYLCEPNSQNKTGIAEGKLIGGNLSIIAHLIGTSSNINTKNKILFLEDVGEYIYNIDRMMMQLKRSGMLKHLSALIIGGFTEMKDTNIPFGQDVYELIFDKVKEYNYPVCFDFPVSHTEKNYALKIGVKHQLAVEKNKVNLKEII
ncbi:MAG: S66 peptidase family protein [Chitinophagaceae bacterium]